ncbi:MAG: cobyrinate a,c-diamide synthase [Ferroplasma sp.]
MHNNGILIAAPFSGNGKTTISLGIMLALKSKGYNVQPFKVGPDYIDPGFHTYATGNSSYNLDTVMGNKKIMKEIYYKNSEGKDISVIEGVMGLYDGKSGNTSHGSSFEISNELGIPVIMVLDISSMGRSAAAIVKGFQKMDRRLKLGGVILNKAGTDSHCSLVKNAVEKINHVPVLGCIKRNSNISLNSRYLGLIPQAEKKTRPEYFELLKNSVLENINLDKIVEISTHAKDNNHIIENIYNKRRKPVARIAIAYSRAFNFYYRENFDLLEKFGAELCYFDPEKDSEIPEADGIYIGGGYPEIYAEQLSENKKLLDMIRNKIEDNMPVFAECGGYMYLSQAIVQNNIEYRMVGLIPAVSYMEKLVLGYRSAKAEKNNFLFNAGDSIRGHEFHHSNMKYFKEPEHIFRLNNGSMDGYSYKNMVAGYTHFYFPSNPRIPARFIAACLKYKKARHK